MKKKPKLPGVYPGTKQKLTYTLYQERFVKQQEKEYTLDNHGPDLTFREWVARGGPTWTKWLFDQEAK